MALVDTGNLMVWQALRPYLPPGTVLKSVYRSPERQLAFIVSKAKALGYGFSKPPRLEDPSTWKGALEHVRAKGYKVAEPGRSIHQRAMAYDLAGPNLQRIEAAVRKAVAEGRIQLLRESRNPILVETVNRCVHVEIEAATLDFEPFEHA